MTRTRTFSLLTILLSLGLLVLGFLANSIGLNGVMPSYRFVALLIGSLTLITALKTPNFLTFGALILAGVLGITLNLSVTETLTPLISLVQVTLTLIFLGFINCINFSLRDNHLYSYPSQLRTLLERSFPFSDGLSGLASILFFKLLFSTFSMLPIQTGVFENFYFSATDLSRISHFIGVFAGLVGVYWYSKLNRINTEKVDIFYHKVGTAGLTLLGVISFIEVFFPFVKIMMLASYIVCGALFTLIMRKYLEVKELEKNILGERAFSVWSDLLEITKPRLGLLVMSTVFVGMMLAPNPLNFFTGLAGFSYTFLLVMGAAAFNCWMEKDVDALMDRTKYRPLPQGRLHPQVALIFSSVLMVVSLAGLYFYVNHLTALLGLIAALLYVFAYTPLKLKSVLALYVGAIPGALPPLMGWTIVMGQMTHIGWVLFWILFVWQLPHFLAISIYHAKDYEKADIKIYPNSFGLKLTKFGIMFLTFILSAVSLYPWLYNLGVSDRFGYFALLLNIIFTLVSIKVFITPVRMEILLRRWARIYFFGSIIYLPMLLGSMIYFN